MKHVSLLKVTNLYDILLKACNESEKGEFYYSDQVLDEKTYRIFLYRLVGFNTFKENPILLNCRGTMFNITDESKPVLVSLPMQKFFNFGEGEVNYKDKIFKIQEKLDGSLISSYLHNGNLRLKSKGSLTSGKAIAAMDWLDLDENSELKNYIYTRTLAGYTVNLEWTSPDNRIVVGYNKPKLTILGERDIVNGDLILNDNKFYVDHYVIDNSLTLYDMVNQIADETIGEGKVFTFIDINDKLYQMKVKNKKYCNLHKIKDSINNKKALIELIINDQHDDVIAAFHDDRVVVNEILEMESHVIPIYNSMVKTCEDFYKANKSLDRKSYAIKAQTEYKDYMSPLMNLYINRDFSYQEFAIKNLTRFFGVE